MDNSPNTAHSEEPKPITRFGAFTSFIQNRFGSRLSIIVGGMMVVLFASILFFFLSRDMKPADTILVPEQPSPTIASIALISITGSAKPSGYISPTTPPNVGTNITIFPTSTPVVVPPTAVPTSVTQPTAVPTATPAAADTSAPSITSMTGPENGSTVNFKDFCFTVSASDDRSKYPNIYIQHQFDGGSWTEWGSTFGPCFQSVSNGQHSFAAHVRDEAGNVSGTTTRTFTVQTQ